MKFGIGTAQFIKNYGLLKKNSKKKNLIKIVKNYSKKIDLIDTAPSYNNAERIIGSYRNKRIKIISKIGKIKSKNISRKFVEIEKNIQNTFKKLKTKNIYGILFHNTDDIKILKNKDLRLKFDSIVKKNVKKIGFSCYDIFEIEKYLKIYKFDIIQFPLNVFNISKKKINFLKKIKNKYKVELHCRSIFLQGLLLEKELNLNKKFIPLKNKIYKINKLCEKLNISKYNFYISVIASLKIIDYAIIGLSNFNEYEKLKKFKKTKINNNEFYKFKIKDYNILDPRKWNINH